MANPEEQLHEWPVDWTGHREAQLRWFAALTPQERLRWLEEAGELLQFAGVATQHEEPGQSV